MQRTPLGSFTDLSATIITKDSNNPGGTNASTGTTQRIQNKPSPLGAGEDGAGALLSAHETISMLQETQRQMLEEAVDRMSHAMTSKIYEIEERSRHEFALWKRNFEKDMIEMFNNLTLAGARPDPPVMLEPQPVVENPQEEIQQQPEREIRARAENDHNNEWHRAEIINNERIVPPNARYGERPVTQQQNIKIPVHKWGITFNGDDPTVSVEDFIFRLEHLKSRSETPWPVIMWELHKLLEGRAKEWYWRYLKVNGTTDWPTLKEAMKGQYQNTLSDFEITRKMVERKQKPEEKIDEFLQEMSRLRSRLSHNIAEEEMLRIVKGNLKEEVRKILYPMQIYSLQQLRLEYYNVERDFEIKKPRHQFQTVGHRQVNRQYAHEMNFMPPPEKWAENETDYHIDELKSRPVLKCWNCQELGHTYIECKSPRTIFCYKCGRPKVVTPHCPRCRPGNGQASSTSEPQLDPQQDATERGPNN